MFYDTDTEPLTALSAIQELIASGRTGPLGHVKIFGAHSRNRPLPSGTRVHGRSWCLMHLLPALLNLPEEELRTVRATPRSVSKDDEVSHRLWAVEAGRDAGVITVEFSDCLQGLVLPLRLEIFCGSGVILWDTAPQGDVAFMDLTTPPQEQHFHPIRQMHTSRNHASLPIAVGIS